MGPGGAQVDRSFHRGPVKSQQPGPIKPEWEELQAFNSNPKPRCQVSHYPWHQKITGKGAGPSRLPHDFINPDWEGIFMDSIGSRFLFEKHRFLLENRGNMIPIYMIKRIA